VPSQEAWRQLVRAAMGASGNLEEADEASSPADFVAKMKIALREVREARRWLRLVESCQLDHYQRVRGADDEARQLAAIFATIVLNVRRRLAAERAAARRRQSL
jgi:four helix bundle protein